MNKAKKDSDGDYDKSKKGESTKKTNTSQYAKATMALYKKKLARNKAGIK